MDSSYTRNRTIPLILASILEDAREKIVSVGGTACALLLSQETAPHEGTIDVDTLEERLIFALSQQELGKKYRWIRNVLVGSGCTEVKVDLLSDEYDESRRDAKARKGQGVHAGVLRV